MLTRKGYAVYIFLSYGHGDYPEFIARFIKDLERQPFVDHLWTDRRLRLGDEYTDEINKAIDSCDVFLFVNSPHAARAGSYCSGEIQRAVDAGKRIIPLTLDDTPISAIIAGKQKMFMGSAITKGGNINEKEYVKLFMAFIKELKDALRTVSTESHNLKRMSDFDFIDFSGLESELLGRGGSPESVLNKIDDWLRSSNPFLCVMGNPGSGKSTLSAEVHRRYKENSVVYYCRHDDLRSVTPKNIVLQISYSFMVLKDSYAEYIRNNVDFEQLSIANISLKRLFDLLIVDPLVKIHAETNKTSLLIVDALDEISIRQDREALESLLLTFDISPIRNGGLKILLTSRNDKVLRNNVVAIRGKMMDRYEVENLESVQEIVNTFVSSLDYELDESLIEEVMKQSRGDLIYVKFILDEIAYKRPRRLSDLEFPLGMKGVCTKYFDRVFGDDPTYFRAVAAPVLEVLVSAKTPISFSELRSICNINSSDLEGLLSKIGMFVESHQGVITFIHKSLRDWLMSIEPGEKYFIDQAAGLDLLCEYSIKELSSKAPVGYVREFGLTHLSEGGRFADISALMETSNAAFNDVFMRFVEEVVSHDQLKALVAVFKNYADCEAESLFLVCETIKMLIIRSQDLIAKKILRLYRDHSESDILEQLKEFYIKKRENASVDEIRTIAETLVDTLDDKSRVGVMFTLADIYRESGRYAEARDLYIEAREEALLEDLESVAFDCSFALIDLEYVEGNYRKSYEELQNIKDENPVWFETPSIYAYKYYRALGHIYQIIEKDELAKKAYLNSYNVADDLNFLMKRMESANSVAEAQSGFKEGKQYLDEVRVLFESHKLNALEYGKSFYIESDLHYQDGNYARAKDAAAEGIRILEGVGYAGGVAHSCVSRGKAQFKLGRYQEAYEDFQRAVQHYDETEMRPRYRFEAYYYSLKIEQILGIEGSELGDSTLSFFNIEDHPFLQEEYDDAKRLLEM